MTAMARARPAPADARKAAPRRKPPFQLPAFERTLPMLLLIAREAVMQRFRPAQHAHGLTDQQWRVIRALAEVDAIEIAELSGRCALHPASLSRILPKLAADGIVSRSANAADQRRVIVSLTARGKGVLAGALPDSERIYAQLAQDVGPERLAEIYVMLEELIGRLERTRSDAEPE
jgi:homoprotocatechuate degradation regulator HpaR